MVNLLDESIKFMILGMGIVFLLLILIVLLTKLQSIIVTKYFPDKIESNSLPNNNIKDDELVAVISAAIAKYEE